MNLRRGGTQLINGHVMDKKQLYLVSVSKESLGTLCHKGKKVGIVSNAISIAAYNVSRFLCI